MLFLFTSCLFKQFFTILVQVENARLKFAVVITTGAPTAVANDAIEILIVVTNEQLMTYQNS